MKTKAFIKQNGKLFKFIIIPLIIVFSINLLFFIISSFLDLEIMQLFDNLLQYKFFRFFSIFYVEAGYTELYIAFVLIALIIFEYICKHIQTKKGYKSESLIWSVVGILFLIWFALEFMKYYPIFIKENFIYDKYDSSKFVFNLKSLLTPPEYKSLVGFIIIFHFMSLLTIILYVRLVFVKKNNFYEKQYWKESLIVLFYFFIAYGLVGTLKVLMGRNYYNNMEEALIDRAKMAGLELDSDVLSSLVLTPVFQPWWTFNGLIGNPDKINWSLSMLFKGNAFPSGHMAASGMVGMCFIFILNPKNGNLPENWGVTKAKAMGVYLYLLHCFMMQVTFLINGSHWLSDTAFSFMWIIASIYLSIKLSNWVVRKVEISITNKKNKRQKLVKNDK